MTRIRRRKGNRLPVATEVPIVVVVYNNRLEGTVLDQSESGLGIVLPSNCGLKESQNIRIMLDRRSRMAKVARITSKPDGDHVGLKLV